MSPNNNEAQIYSRNGDSWDLQQTLSEVSVDLQLAPWPDLRRSPSTGVSGLVHVRREDPFRS